jgi:cytochrome b561
VWSSIGSVSLERGLVRARGSVSAGKFFGAARWPTNKGFGRRGNKITLAQVSFKANLRLYGDLEQIDMSQSTESIEQPAVKAVVDSGRFDQMSIALHWLTVILIVTQFTTAWWHAAVDHQSRLAAMVLATHRSIGVLTWLVGLTRLVWRHNFAYLPPFPQSMPKLQQTIAKANEYGLYALLVVQPITGLGRVLFRGQPFELFIWKVPALLEENPTIRGLFADGHEFGAKALLVLIGLHTGAALFHRLVLRDAVLQRMLP